MVLIFFSFLQFIAKGASLTRSLGFIREDYPYRKDRMKMYIKPTQYKLWLIITYNDIPITRPEAEWTEADLGILS